ncbi:MAG: TonB-dependent receptor [Flavobacteriales bacterium]|nr:TonB-dependent receptor [Flavobacteriales bacterium]
MRTIITTLLCVVSIALWGQQGTLRGTVRDASGYPLPGATIYITSTSGKGVISSSEGEFSITGLTVGDTVRVSYVGYITRDIVYRSQESIDIVLEEDTSSLNELVVVGYGTQEKKDLTGAITTVNLETLSSQPALTATASLQGKVAGLNIISSGAPGSSPQVRIRGTGTLLSGADPLYVVDGVLTSDIRNINTQDIRSVEVLKDASSAAIYGVRAANGVIIITTSRGESGDMKISYSNYMGFNTIQNRVRMASSALFMQYTNEALQYSNQMPLFDLSQPIEYDTHWIDEISRTGILQEQNISVSGGGKVARYFASASYYKNDGILQTNSYERMTVRLSNDYTISRSIDAGINIGLSTFRSGNAPYAAFTAAYKAAPTIPVKNADGSYAYFPQASVANPVALLEYRDDTSRGTRIQSSAYITIKPWIRGLSFKSEIAVDWFSENVTLYEPQYYVSSMQSRSVSLLSLSRYRYVNWVWNNYFNYEKEWRKNRMNVMIGMSSEQQTSSSLAASRQNVPPQENYWTLDMGDISTATNSSSHSKMNRTSYIARFFYSWDDRYLLTLTGRLDGSSRFPKDNRWAMFPSVGLAWRLSQEPFMRGSNTISDFKLRASWGMLGNDNIGSDAFLYTIATGLNYVQGSDQYIVPGATVTDVKDPDLHWEKTSEWDIGLDFGFFSQRLWGSIDYYIKKTSDALIYAPVDAVFGDPDGAYLTNKADIRNRGVEFTIGYKGQGRGTFTYDVSYNLTYNDNQITAIEGGLPIVSGALGNGQMTTRTQQGLPVGAFWVYETDGIFRTQEELDDWISAGKPVREGTRVGDLRYVDRKADGVLNDEDRYCPGAYVAPWSMGLNMSMECGSWDFAVELYGVFGNKIFNGNMAQRYGNENIQYSLRNRWRVGHTDTSIPRASNVVPLASDFYITDGKYLKVNTATVGFTLPESITSRIHIKRMRIYLSALNPLVLKAYTGYSAQLPAGTLNSGVDVDSYPQVSSYILGMNINF